MKNVMYAVVYFLTDWGSDTNTETKIIGVHDNRDDADRGVVAMSELLAEVRKNAQHLHLLMRSWENRNPAPDEPENAGSESEESPVWRDWREQYNKWVDAHTSEEERLMGDLKMSKRPNFSLLHMSERQYFQVMEIPILKAPSDTMDVAIAFLEKKNRI
jgi:hypothetical protein